MTTEDKQRIIFEQGAPLTGDSGERGNALTSDGGVESVKPVNDGERAHQAIFRRPEENIRKRTEVLRTAGEQEKYLSDQMRWSLTPGRADGAALAPEAPMPVIAWNPVTGVFTFSEDAVLQPINTPDTDKQESVQYLFDAAIPVAEITFSPINGAEGKRAYNGANLMEIIWLEVPDTELGSAAVPGQCDAAITGDPARILTITIRDDGLTQMSHLQTALAVVGAPAFTAMGLQYAISGTLSTLLPYSSVTDPDFVFTGTFDREVHFIPVETWSNFFAIPHSLDDGDTLAIEWAYFVEDDPGIDGRRQRIPSNISGGDPDHTTVFPAQLFITSDYPERIPLSIPLCKRVGDDLFWIDGTVSYGDGTVPIYLGEHGYTVERVISATNLNITEGWFTSNPPSWAAGATINSSINGILADLSRTTTGGGAVEIGKAPYGDPGAQTWWSQQAAWIPGSISIGAWLDFLLVEVNKCTRVAWLETINGDWTFSATDDDTGGGSAAFAESTSNAIDPTHSAAYASTGNPASLITRRHAHEHLQQVGGDAYAHVFNRPLSGFYTRSGINHDDTGSPGGPNAIWIGGGVASVAGRYIKMDGFLLANMWTGVVGKGGLTTNTKSYITAAHPGVNDYVESCYCLYVWLRVDGTFHFDIYGPEFSGNHWEVDSSTMYYRPRAASGLPQAGFSVEEYTLVDVCWIVQGNVGGGGEGGLRYAGMVPMGGGYRHFEGFNYRSGVPVYTEISQNLMVDNPSVADDVSALLTNRYDGTSPWKRTPGIPIVSNKARMSMSLQITFPSTPIARIYFAAGVKGVDAGSMTLLPYLANNEHNIGTVAQPELVYSAGLSIVAEGVEGAATYYNTGDVAVARNEEITIPRTIVGIQTHSAGTGSTPTGVTRQLYNEGFYWDKFNGGADVSDFRYFVPPV